jgi:hypothetical protein
MLLFRLGRPSNSGLARSSLSLKTAFFTLETAVFISESGL